MSYGTFSTVVPYQNDKIQAASDRANWVYPASPDPQYLYKTVSRSRSGGSYPAYKRVIAAGGNATTSFTGTRETFDAQTTVADHYGSTVGSGMADAYLRKGRQWWHGNLAVPPLPLASLKPLAQNRAQTAFYKACTGAIRLFEGGTALGELRETLHMIRNPAKALRSSLDDYLASVSKYRRYRPKDKDKALADTWLEYAFGWTPLINDAAEALSYLERRKAQLARSLIKVRGEGSNSSTTFSEAYQLNGTSYVYATQRNVATTTVRYLGAVSSTASGTSTFDGRALGLSVDNFVPTVWNLLPWSFLVDYFTNVGDVLSAWSLQHVKLAWGCETTRSFTQGTLTGIYHRTSLNREFEKRLAPGFGTSSKSSVGRLKITYVPIPELYIEIPGLSTKWVNMAALLASRKRLSPL